MEYKFYDRVHICEYCGTAQRMTDIWLCIKCGAPLRPQEKVSLARKVLSIFDNVETIEWAEGIDVSKWQGNMNWATAQPLIDYTIIKASENTWEDGKYAVNVDACLSLGIYYGVYHFCRPEYDWRAQAEFFADRVTGQLPAWADLETNGGLSPSQLERWLYNFVSAVEDRSGYSVGIYTRASFWNPYVARNAWCNLHPLWVARYNSYISDPGVPLDWDMWHLWQWSADGNGEGSKYGAESNSIDKNRFNGTTEQLVDWIGDAPPVIPPIDPPTDEPCTQYAVNVNALNVRSGPRTTFPVVGQLHNGDTISVVDLAGSDVWVEIEEGRFCAHTYGGKQYLDIV